MMNILTKIIKRSLFISIFTSLFFILNGCQLASHEKKTEKKIGIIVPLENKSLDDIVAGFTETLTHQSPVPIKFKIANAQGDINIQRAIIQQMKSEHYDIIVPIGSIATQMAIAMSPHQPIVSLAASYRESDRKQQQPCNISVVHDEISPRQIIAFIHQVYPALTQLTLIHSPSDKIFPDVKVAIAAGKQLGINIKAIMVPSLNELYSVANALPQNTQGILILKDIMIASGISTLETVAQKKHLPLITSDQGTVQEGAAFALGVHERDIGMEGAKLAAAILAGKKACDLPIVEMTRLTVFINQTGLKNENQSITPIEAAANHLQYAIEIIGAKGAK